MTDDRAPFREARDAGLKARHEQRLARYEPQVGSTPHPGETLREVIEASDREQVLWARDLGISEKHLSQILHGKVHYSADLAVRLEAISGVSAELLMRLKADYEVDQARMKASTP